MIFIEVLNGQFPAWTTLIFRYEEKCYEPVCDPSKIKDLINIDASYFSWPIMLQLCVFILNFIIQLLAIIFVYSKKKFQKGSFFVMIIILAVSVVLRGTVFILTTIVAANTKDKSSLNIFSTTIALHMDYCSDYFSMILIFCMALNRCLIFTAQQWNDWIFDGKRVCIPVAVSLAGGILSSEITIFTNGIVRTYIPTVGYIDYGMKQGYRETVNRIFHMFPIGAIFCYAILFRHLRKESRKMLTLTDTRNPRNRGDQKVFVQLLFTSLFYTIMALIVELLQLITFSDDVTQTLIALLNTFNYLPEISLPFLLVWDSLKQRNRVAVVVVPSLSQSNGRPIS